MWKGQPACFISNLLQLYPKSPPDHLNIQKNRSYSLYSTEDVVQLIGYLVGSWTLLESTAKAKWAVAKGYPGSFKFTGPSEYRPIDYN